MSSEEDVRTRGNRSRFRARTASAYRWRGPNGPGFEPGFRVEVVDTLRAGDVFHGAYALALAERKPPADAARFASAAAALKCTRRGRRAGIPARNEVERLIAS